MHELIEKLEYFLQEEQNFLVKLRVYDEFDKKNFFEFFELLDKIKEECKGKSVIEKKLSFLLCDCVTSMFVLVISYSKNNREEIELAAFDLNEKVLEILNG
jgi:hypothetical protein